jgi:hypothetical protein
MAIKKEHSVYDVSAAAMRRAALEPKLVKSKEEHYAEALAAINARKREFEVTLDPAPVSVGGSDAKWVN